jgi:hypothetical protein
VHGGQAFVCLTHEERRRRRDLIRERHFGDTHLSTEQVGRAHQVPERGYPGGAERPKLSLMTTPKSTPKS